MASNFEIQDNVLVKYTGDDEEVIIPDGIIEIGSDAFCDYGQSKIQKVICPSSLKEIGSFAFAYCKALREVVLPDGIELIRFGAFSYTGLVKINIPINCKIEEGAIRNCDKLINTDSGLFVFQNRVLNVGKKEEVSDNKIVIDEGLESIDGWAFDGHHEIRFVVFPKTMKRIETYAFRNCGVGTLKLQSFPEYGYGAFDGCYLRPESFDSDTVLYYYFSAGNSIKSAAEKCESIIKKDLIKNMNRTLDLLEESDSKKAFDKFSKYIVANSSRLPKEFFEKANILFIQKKMKSASNLLVKYKLVDGDAKQVAQQRAREEKKLKQQKELEEQLAQQKAEEKKIDDEKLARGERPDEKEAEALADKYWSSKLSVTSIDSYAGFTTGVYYKNSKIEVEPKVIGAILDVYIRLWRTHSKTEYGSYGSHQELRAGWTVPMSQEADRIYSYLDEKSMDNCLLGLVASSFTGTYDNSKIYVSPKNDYRLYVLALGRFATDDLVQKLILAIKSQAGEQAKNRLWASNVEQALYLNDSIYAIQYFESKRCLDNYAKMRGTTAQQIRDTQLVPDLGFDVDGTKKFLAGDINVIARVMPNLSLELFDINADKAVRSFPKKGADDAALESLKKEYDEFKKNVIQFGKRMASNIERLHVNQESINKDIWQKVYLDNPVVSVLSKAIVWIDDDNNFIPTDNGIIDVNGNPYVPKDSIRVANVITMNPITVTKWQDYFVKNNIKQPFDQIWEPVLNIGNVNISERYKRLHLSNQERNALKKVLKSKGIDVYSDKMEGEFDHRNWNYEFYEYNTMHFDQYIDVEYRINDDKSIDFNELTVHSNAPKEAINTIVFELEKAIIKQDISSDSDELLTEEKLDQFTLSQIISFINLATQNKANKCGTVLLDYKNKRYGDYDYMNELALDL